MSEAATTTTAAPASAPAAGAAPAPAAAESLLSASAGAPAPAPSAVAPATGGADDLAWLPEKHRVNGADGQIDMAASAKKLGEAYGALSQKLGQPPAVPANASEYSFDIPDQFKDVAMDETMSAAFRERAHKAGLSVEQYQFVMGEYFSLVPEMLNGAAQKTADQARSALQQVWGTETEYTAGVNAAQRAMHGLPSGLAEEAVQAGLGTNPAFIKIMAALGKEMREDRPPRTGTASPAADVDSLMASEAYRDRKHPQHAAVSAQVRQYFEQQNP